MKQELLTPSPSNLTVYVFVLYFHMALLLTVLVNSSSIHSGFSVAAMFVTGDLAVCLADTIKCETETVNEPLILGAFAELRKETQLLQSCLYVRPFAWTYSNIREIWYLSIFRNSVEKV